MAAGWGGLGVWHQCRGGRLAGLCNLNSQPELRVMSYFQMHISISTVAQGEKLAGIILMAPWTKKRQVPGSASFQAAVGEKAFEEELGEN